MEKIEVIAEKWKKIPGYGSAYVSDQGRVQINRTYTVDDKGNYKIVHGKIMKGSMNAGGYVSVSLAKRNRKTKKTWLVHRLVCLAFLENPKNKPHVNHKNGVKNDNRLVNLEWCTPAENSRHAHKLRKRLGIQTKRETKAVAPEPYVHVPGTPWQEYSREKCKITLTELHYKDKIKKGLIPEMPEHVIRWRKEFEALEVPVFPEE
jgi:hypothetical protein